MRENKEENKEDIFFLSASAEKEKKVFENNEEVCSLDELRQCVKMLVAKEEVPWRNTEESLSDWWLLCESKGYKIKKRSAHLAFMKYLRGGDKKKNEEERMAWENAQRRKAVKEKINLSEEREKREIEEKERKARLYIENNPSKLAEIEAIAYDRALVLAKGKSDTALRLKMSLVKKVAYEMSEGIIF